MTEPAEAAHGTAGRAYRDPAVIARLLHQPGTWAVVGLGDDPAKPAYGVAAFLQAHGKRIIPVHPRAREVLGEPGYRSLAEIPDRVDVVDVFRRSDQAGAFADQGVQIGARAVWFQLGVVDEEAAGRVTAAGLDMVMDTCPKIEWPRLR